MKKCAIFAEGGTEQAFAKRLFYEIAEKNSIQIERIKVKGKKSSRTGTRIDITASTGTERYFVVIYDCTGDGQVKTDIEDRYEGLCRAGYQSIIGIRDVLGQFTAADAPALGRALYHGLRQTPIKTVMVLAIMEIEAWFVAEHTHFGRINTSLNMSHVQSIVGFDPSVEPERVETIQRPADDLNRIYQLVGDRYEKLASSTQRTIEALDCTQVYFALRDKVSALGPLITAIDLFLG